MMPHCAEKRKYKNWMKGYSLCMESNKIISKPIWILD